MMERTITFVAVVGLLLTPVSAAKALTTDRVTVGDPGNAGDMAWDASEGYPGGLGDVAAEYQIGKYEVTNDQYAEFLNAAAGVGDPYGLYNASMGTDPRGGITESGGVYSVKTNMGNKPVNYVSWYDALRFSNWMHNGQGAGDTETGAYNMSLGDSAAREANAQVFLPNIDEWWKAAFYEAGGPDYWDGATQSNDVNPPAVTADSVGDGSAGDTGVFANWNSDADWNGQDGNVTSVGTNGGPSPYGTHDQNGNVWEFCEDAPTWDANLRITMGGSWLTEAGGAELRPYIEGGSPSLEDAEYGFRVASLPSLPGLVWDGGVGNWADSNWNTNQAVAANMDMVINADTANSDVTVAADFIYDGGAGTGPAKSVFVGEEYDARLTVASGVTLEVTEATTAGEFGKIAVENGALLQTGSAVIEPDGRLIAGVQGADSGLLQSAGQLALEEIVDGGTEEVIAGGADAVQVDWLPGADATSMFGGVYTIATYTGTALTTTGTTANEDANIGAGYIKSVDYDADLGSGVLGVQVELQPQGLGDTDLDADVDGDDLATFGLAWSPSGTDKTWFDGDFDFDGDIDGDDLAALGLAWAPGGISFPAGDIDVTAVPEPCTIVMLLIGAAGLLIYRKRPRTTA